MTTVRKTNRWRGVLAVTLVAGAAGLLASRADFLLLAAVGVVFAVYPHVTSPPDPDVTIDRRVSDSAPSQETDVEVTVSITNAGASSIADLRIVDGVPAALSVVEGSPRHGTALRAGSTTSFSYTVETRPGRHHFEPTTVVARDLSGTHEVETTTSAETALDCSTSASTSLRSQTLESVGTVPSTVGGVGVEFFSTREYQRTDARGRVDWKRYAKTGRLTTVEFRKERAAAVVLLVDARQIAYRGEPDEPHAVSYGVAAADQLLGTLLESRNQVGLAAFGRTRCWLEPGAGRDHRIRAQRLIATHPALSATPPTTATDIETQRRLLSERLPRNAQLVLLSPLSDDGIVRAARRLDAEGHAVTVVSPDVTGGKTVGETLAYIERSNRLRRLRQADISVVEWRPPRPLAAAIETAQRGRT